MGPGYPCGQIAKAFTTAATHEDIETRRRAEKRVYWWERVLAGMAGGTLDIGARTPVPGLPAWVTPEIVRGGFATGEAAAGGPLLDHETELAERVGVPPDRRSLFIYHLTEQGLADLSTMLDTGYYRVEQPEEAGLLTVAWLLRAGDRLGALVLLDILEPFSDRLRFLPRPAATPTEDAGVVYRRTAGEVHSAVAAHSPNEQVEAMREALTVWNPFADELLDHWSETMADGRVAARVPDTWRERGAELLERYASLAARHTRCTKHRRPKENIAILRGALAETVAGHELPPRQRGLLQHAVDSMMRRRGRPGSHDHTELRARQRADTTRPTHYELARVLAGRLARLDQRTGIRDIAPLLRPVTAEEERQNGPPAASAFPMSMRRRVTRAWAAPVDELVEHGAVPSAEVLADLIPRISAATVSASYPDPALSSLMAATHRAFADRRSLLLLNLEHQVRITELPWVSAVGPHRQHSNETREHSRATLVRVAHLALWGFPATVLPNPLLQELGALAHAAGVDLPLVEELAADIFTGTFTVKFQRAAELASRVLDGSLYARYYGTDYPAIGALPHREDGSAEQRQYAARSADAFAELCRARAGYPRGGVAANGMVLEQAQILTTHNLAALVDLTGSEPDLDWMSLTHRCFSTVCRLVARVHNNPFPMSAVKDAAHAWRQMLFFLSLCETEEQEAFAGRARHEVRGQPDHVAARLGPALAGLEHVVSGGQVGHDGTAGEGRRFLGWAQGDHWMLEKKAPKPSV